MFVSLLFRYDHPDILAGQGTMGLEIIEQVENIDAVIIPVGGAGLLAGSAVAIKYLYPNIQIIVSAFCFVWHCFAIICGSVGGRCSWNCVLCVYS